jgi:phospholipase/carboxylesterase
MWIFSSRLPRQGLLIAPRGLYPAPSSGYGWHAYRPGSTPQVNEYYPAIAKLRNLLSAHNFPTADFSKLNLVGFSQGAALAFTFLLTHPELIQSAAGLSGFLPEGAGDLASQQPIRAKRVFIAHGTQDQLVPVALARQAIETLEHAGAIVTYCEDEVGHKLSASCFRGLEAFFSELVFGCT